MKRWRAVMAAAAAVALGLGLAGCGDDDDARAAGPPSPDDTAAPGGAGNDSTGAVTVVARDIAFSADGYEAGAGSVTITYRNEGAIEHTLRIEGNDAFRLDVPANGDVDEGLVQLAPGTYVVYCDVAGHRAAGMEATLEVD